MKILYLTDLDGTLLSSAEHVSDYTAKVVNSFIKNGGCFSYATARSFVTASKVTENLNIPLPVICFNGGFTMDGQSGEILASNYFTLDLKAEIMNAIPNFDILPIVFAHINGIERFSYVNHSVNCGTSHFLDRRKNDNRRREVQVIEELFEGDTFTFVFIGDLSQTQPIYDYFASNKEINCIHHKDVYSGSYWLELLPAKVSKANAALELKKMLGCDKLIVFGDGANDLSMFLVADQCYAMENAVPELKEIATGIIGTNDNDGVAKWLEANVI